MSKFAGWWLITDGKSTGHFQIKEDTTKDEILRWVMREQTKYSKTCSIKLLLDGATFEAFDKAFDSDEIAIRVWAHIHKTIESERTLASFHKVMQIISECDDEGLVALRENCAKKIAGYTEFQFLQEIENNLEKKMEVFSDPASETDSEDKEPEHSEWMVKYFCFGNHNHQRNESVSQVGYKANLVLVDRYNNRERTFDEFYGTLADSFPALTKIMKDHGITPPWELENQNAESMAQD